MQGEDIINHISAEVQFSQKCTLPVLKKASQPFIRSLAYGIYSILFVFCSELFCNLQQAFKGLLLLRLLNQFCKQGAEYICAVPPQCCCDIVDAVLQFFDGIIGRFGFCK